MEESQLKQEGMSTGWFKRQPNRNVSIDTKHPRGRVSDKEWSQLTKLQCVTHVVCESLLAF